MSILSVDDIQPVGSGTSVTVNSAATLVTNNINSSGVVTATSFSGDGSALTNVGTGELISKGNTKAQVVDTGSDGHFKIETEGTERFRIISNGYVGIGTTNPTELFDIQSDNSAELRLYTKASTSNATLNLRAGNSGNSKIEFGDTADDDIGVLKYVHSNNTLQYSYYSNERIRIGSQGQIGIEGENYGETGQVLKSNGSVLHTSGTYYFANNPIDLTAVFSVKLKSEIKSRSFFPTAPTMNTLGLDFDPLAAANTTGFAAIPSFTGNTPESNNVQLYVRTTQQNPNDPSFVSDENSPSCSYSTWRPFNNAEFKARAYEFKAELTTNDNTAQLAVYGLKIISQMTRRTINGSGTTLTNADLQINFANNFVSTPIIGVTFSACLLYTSPSPRDVEEYRMPSSA